MGDAPLQAASGASLPPEPSSRARKIDELGRLEPASDAPGAPMRCSWSTTSNSSSPAGVSRRTTRLASSRMSKISARGRSTRHFRARCAAARPRRGRPGSGALRLWAAPRRGGAFLGRRRFCSRRCGRVRGVLRGGSAPAVVVRLERDVRPQGMLSDGGDAGAGVEAEKDESGARHALTWHGGERCATWLYHLLLTDARVYIAVQSGLASDVAVPVARRADDALVLT